MVNVMESQANSAWEIREASLSQMRRQARARTLQSQLSGERLARINNKLTSLLDDFAASQPANAEDSTPRSPRSVPEPPVTNSTTSLTL